MPALFTLAILWCSDTAEASDYGTTGLIDIPTARMRADSTLAITAAFEDRYQSYMFTYQATPWFEATFRYTGFEEFFNWDRNYGIKFKLWDETINRPALAVGIRDLIGTGKFSTEYVVASKRFGHFDASLGLGWGRLAGSGDFANPLAQLFPRFEERTARTGSGGQFSTGDFFSGPDVGFFGGVSYAWPDKPITLMAEYNPDNYDYEFGEGGARPKSPISFGLNWEFSPGVELAVTRQHGDSWGVRLTSQINTSARPPRYEAPVFQSASDLAANQLPPQIQKARWYDRLLFDIERAELTLNSATLYRSDQMAVLEVGNPSYAYWPDAVARLNALADLHLPPFIRTIHLVIVEDGHKVATIVTPRPSTFYDRDVDALSYQQKILPGRIVKTPRFKTNYFTNKVNFDINVDNRLQLFDPDDPARYQFYLELGATYRLNSSWSVIGRYGYDLTNNFDESLRKESNSRLPRVRTDIVKYLTEGETGLSELYIDGRDSLTPNLHYRVYAGILEDMYAGAGGEVLYMPFQSRVAFGASAYYAKKRQFDKGFGLLDYATVNGFVSAYWASPYHNYDFAAHLGRYLAEDVGGTFEVRRTFDNGWQVGLWATFTDVSTEDFGEGSFDKGFFFKIPLSGLFGSNTRASYATRLRPIQRDGGQRLENYSGSIWWDLREARYDAFMYAEERMAR
jgi:hypothetical protein